MGEADRGRGRAARGGAFLLAGVVGIVGGCALLAYGLAPARDLWEAVAPAFSSGTPPEDLSERLEAAMDALKGRVLVDAFGFLALVAGIVLVRLGLAKPKGKSVAELVEAEVERRLRDTQSPVGVAGPALQPTRHDAVVAAPAVAPRVPSPPAAAVALRRTHCAACGSVLVAGGRICPQGHGQA